jgi:hypothetical protein
MALPRPGSACLLAGALALTACASSVPWPPPRGSCIEAENHGRGKRSHWLYTIDGHSASRSTVEKAVFTSPAWQEKARKYDRLSIAGPALFIAGDAATLTGVMTTGFTGHSLWFVLSAAGFVSVVAGMVIGFTLDDPFRPAVVEMNNSPRRWDICSAKREPPAPPSPPPSPLDQTPYDGDAGGLIEKGPPPPPPAIPPLPSPGWVP